MVCYGAFDRVPAAASTEGEDRTSTGLSLCGHHGPMRTTLTEVSRMANRPLTQIPDTSYYGVENGVVAPLLRRTKEERPIAW